MEDALRKHDFVKQQTALKYRQEEYAKEMEECTFSPMFHRATPTARALEQKLVRHGRHFDRAQKQFLAKKQSHLDQRKREEVKADKGLQAKAFMCEGSKKIIRDRSQNLDRSASLLNE